MNIIEIVRSEEEINSVIAECIEGQSGGSRFPGMTYEQGILDFYSWLVGETDEHPYPDE